MYYLSVLLLMLLFPAASVLADHFYWHPGTSLVVLIGSWFVFWAAGVRLFVAGWRQVIQPKFTSETIFGIKSDDALPIVRELGIANIATGTVGILSLAFPAFVLPVAIVGAIFYGAAGVVHVFHSHRNRLENVAMVSDLLASLVFAAYVAFEAMTPSGGAG